MSNDQTPSPQWSNPPQADQQWSDPQQSRIISSQTTISYVIPPTVQVVQPVVQVIQPVPRNTKGQGLGITAMVLGILAALICFIPILNVFGVPLAAIGFLLGILAMIRARGGRGPIGFGVAGFVLSVIALGVTIGMYALLLPW